MNEFRKLGEPGELNYREMDERVIDGLVTVITIDESQPALRGILMVAFANQEAVENTVETGLATYWSRSRNELWIKGETSGNMQPVNEIYVDCDGDAIVYSVDPAGPACHKGTDTCFVETDDEVIL